MSTAKRGPKSRRPMPEGNPAKRWIELFLDYCRSECHLAENTVAAYRRNLAKFAEWLAARKIQSLSINDLADYPAWLNARKLAPASVARHLVSLKVFFRYLQVEGVLQNNLAELLGSQKLWQRVPQVLVVADDRQAADCPDRARCAVAARSGIVGIAVCHRLPGVGSVKLAARRRAFARGILSGARQGRTRAAGSAGRPGDCRRAGVSGA